MFFARRLEQLCELRRQRPSVAAKEMGITSSSMSDYINGQLPNATSLIRIASYYEVSIDWLLGRSDEPALAKAARLKEDGFHYKAGGPDLAALAARLAALEKESREEMHKLRAEMSRNSALLERLKRLFVPKEENQK